ncbi:MAG: hypothetical protein VCE91_20415 [Nitrospinota bacterium]
MKEMARNSSRTGKTGILTRNTFPQAGPEITSLGTLSFPPLRRQAGIFFPGPGERENRPDFFLAGKNTGNIPAFGFGFRRFLLICEGSGPSPILTDKPFEDIP